MRHLEALQRLVWKPDRMILDDLVFRLEHYRSEDWDGGEHLVFYKTKGLIDQYEQFFRRVPELACANLFELGIFDGGSIAFWNELFRPNRHVAVDIEEREDSRSFQRYVASHDAGDGIRTFWGTDQGDKSRLSEIVDGNFGGPLDLVIDDASHCYVPTKASFEALFPSLRAGGFYIIEDWAWAHWPEFATADHAWTDDDVLNRLVFELTEAAGTSEGLISCIVVYRGFVAVERGPAPIEAATFSLEANIFRRPSTGDG